MTDVPPPIAGLDPEALERALRELLDRLDLGFAVKEAGSLKYLHVNARLAGWLGSTPEAMRGTADAQWLEASQWPALRTAENAALAMTRGALTEHKLELAGTRREFDVARIALRGGDGAPAALLGLWIDRSAQRQVEAKLALALAQLEQQQQAAEALRRETQDHGARDALTGLFQKEHFEDQLRREVDLSSREHREFSLVAIELDPLPAEAQALGTPARTRVLEALGRLLRGNTRAMDASCRLDDSRFGVLLSGVGLATAHARMEGLRRQCATQMVVLEGRNLGFTVSMGVASFPHTAHTQEALVQAAEIALAEARKRGGNHVTLASIRFELP
ncbi:GGDEF domain-containing protein [Piscinibacter sp.]|uniref:GGDEF domain-containing protein n=1 Tax=Piscinibacter sp. TaxID=1903157 RepID=UPI0039E388FC